MNMKIVGISVSVLVSLVVLAGVLMPILDDATATTDTFTNKGIFYLDKIDSTTDVIIAWDYTTPGVISVGDKSINLPTDPKTSTIVCSDTWGIRYISDPTNSQVTLFDNTASTEFSASVLTQTNFTITISNGEATITNGTDSETETATNGYYISDKGPYVMKGMTSQAYLNGDSIIFVTGRTGGLSALTSSTVSLNVSGSIDDGVIATSLWPDTYTTSDTTVNATEESDYIDLYAFTSVQFNVTDTASHTASATYGQVIVPSEVTAEKSVHLTDNQNALLLVIPMIVIVAILIGVVALVIRSRLD